MEEINESDIQNLTRDDFLLTDRACEYVRGFCENKFRMQQVLALVSERAKIFGIKNFQSMFKTYIKSMTTSTVYEDRSVTQFTGQPMALYCDGWTADDGGITRRDRFGFEIMACPHPIMPVQRLVNVDSGEEKLTLYFKKGKVWKTLIAEKDTLSSNTAIVKLAKYGISVTSDSARHLVNYLGDVDHLNYESIPKFNSVSRLGWIDGYGFSPYVEELVFDGDLEFKHFFDSVKIGGDYEKWLEVAKTVRNDPVIQSRIVLAASFASVLVKPLNALCFFVHLWGTTEAGKTVASMLAASVWGKPSIGDYIRTLDSTAVGQEMAAGFVNSMPLILDELQLVNERVDLDKVIYRLAEGVGRMRGSKQGGIQQMKTWRNCIITSGEAPICGEYSGGGAVNRVISLECNDGLLFKDPAWVADTVRENYGFAGEIFVKKLQEPDVLKTVKKLYKTYIGKFNSDEFTDKQIASAALILTADALATLWIFEDDKALTVEDIEPYLTSKRDVSNNERAYLYLLDSIEMNQNKFKRNEYDSIWGIQDDDYVYIIKKQFNIIMKEGGFNPDAVLSWLVRTGKAEKGADNKNTKVKKVSKNGTRCVWLKKIEEVTPSNTSKNLGVTNFDENEGVKNEKVNMPKSLAPSGFTQIAIDEDLPF